MGSTFALLLLLVLTASNAYCLTLDLRCMQLVLQFLHVPRVERSRNSNWGNRSLGNPPDCGFAAGTETQTEAMNSVWDGRATQLLRASHLFLRTDDGRYQGAFLRR